MTYYSNSSTDSNVKCPKEGKLRKTIHSSDPHASQDRMGPPGLEVLPDIWEVGWWASLLLSNLISLIAFTSADGSEHCEKKNVALTVNCYEGSKTSSASTGSVAVSTRVFACCHTLVCVCVSVLSRKL